MINMVNQTLNLKQMFCLYDKGKAQSITDAGTEIMLKMSKTFRAFGRKAKIERIYEKGYNSVGSFTSFEEHQSSGWRKNTETITKR
jgi:hypothetical protein